jgi:hypothetical protein
MLSILSYITHLARTIHGWLFEGLALFPKGERVEYRYEPWVGPVPFPPVRPSLNEVNRWSLFPGRLREPTTWDMGIRLNRQEGVWIYVTGLSYHEMLDAHSTFSLEKVLDSDFVGYYTPPRPLRYEDVSPLLTIELFSFFGKTKPIHRPTLPPCACAWSVELYLLVGGVLLNERPLFTLHLVISQS